MDRYFLLGDQEVTYFAFDEPSSQVGSDPGHRELQWEPAGVEVALHWRDPNIDSWIEDRAASADLISTATMFGAELQIYDYEPGRKITALWLSGDTTMEFHAEPVSTRRFMRLLRQLRIVDREEFEAALPPGSLNQPASTVIETPADQPTSSHND